MGAVYTTSLSARPAPSPSAIHIHSRSLHFASSIKQLGVVSTVSFKDITATGENGIFIAGGPMGVHPPGQRRPVLPPSLSGISLKAIQLQLVKRTDYPGGCQDFRPSSNDTSGGTTGSPADGSPATADAWWPSGLDCSAGGTAPLWVSGAEKVSLVDIAIQHQEPLRKDWYVGAWIDPFSTWQMQVSGEQVGGCWFEGRGPGHVRAGCVLLCGAVG